jgi:hypothetical protein
MHKKENKKVSFVAIIAILVFEFYPTFPLISFADEIPTEHIEETSSSSNPIDIPLTGNMGNETTEVTSTSETSTPERLLDSTSSESTSTQVNHSDNENTVYPQSGSTTQDIDGGNVIQETVSPVGDVRSSTTSTDKPENVDTLSDSSTTEPFLGFISTGTSTLATSTAVTRSDTADEGNNDSDATSTESTTTEEDTTGALPSGTTTITTGEAVATANILNILNTNLINSSGTIMMANMTDGYNGTLDLRNFASSGIGAGCTLLICNGIDSITANIESNASINNTIDLLATTGSNQINTAETGVISTGNADAGLNLVNVANTNFIDSNYLLLSLNSFKTINGDIVLPSVSGFFSTPSSSSSLSNLNIVQSGGTSNNINVNANSGNNGIDALNGMMYTGDSNSSLNIYNNMGSTLVGGNSISILLKVSGNWLGKLFGLPSENIFVQDGNTRTLEVKDGLSSVSSNEPVVNDIHATSTANINNDVKVMADTGNNTTAMTETSLINTGNSRAAANVINIANTNVIGHNWILAIINIFGDFNGNISLGRPDLWLGEQVVADSLVQNGTKLTYKITVINKGDSSASGSVISMSYDSTHLEINDSSIPFTKDDSGKLLFTISSLAPNDTEEITIHSTVKDTTPGMAIINKSTVTELETDNNINDNTDSTTVTTWQASGGGGGGWLTLPANTTPLSSSSTTTEARGGLLSSLAISVSRVSSSTTIVGMGTEGEQMVVIRNLSNSSIVGVTFNDSLYDQSGNEIQVQKWDLGTVLPNEEITLSYKLYFDNLAQPGIFTLSSELRQTNGLSLSYINNGTITYVVPRESITILSSSTSVVSSKLATPSPLVHYNATTTSAKQTVNRVVSKEGRVLGVFTESLLPEVAYAQSLGLDLSTKNNIIHYFVYFMLFLGMSFVRIFR